MTVEAVRYLDVAATRIQAWLGRSATLRGRRGASRMLAECTQKQNVQQWIATCPDLAGLRWNDEGGDVDGVVSLVVPESLDVWDVATTVMAYLRDALPRVQLTATQAAAPSYVEAHRIMRQSMETGEDVLVRLPPSRSMPLARICRDCGCDAVVTVGFPIANGETCDVCADCEARYDSKTGAGRTTEEKPDLIPGPELRLAEWLRPELPGSTVESIFQSFPNDFSELAERATGPDGRPGTHNALVFADGNQIGEFIKHAVAAGFGKARLVPMITETNKQAVLQGVRDVLVVQGSTDAVPVAPHLIAGDDLLLSLPATLAWPFLRAYLPTFGRSLPAVKDRQPPSVSAGVVFAKDTYAFTDVVVLAEQALAQAKRAVRGAESSVCWLDVTADGPVLDSARTVLRTSVILAHEQLLHDLATTTSASLRHTLRTAAKPRALAERLGAHAVLPFLDNDELPLPVALDLIRWWR